MSNSLSLREALSDVTAVLEDILDAFSRGEGGVYKSDVAEAIDNARAALALPRKNYEVGTPEEQINRFTHYCDSKVCNRRDCSCGYEELFRHKCAIRWAQMPYNEDEDKKEVDK